MENKFIQLSSAVYRSLDFFPEGEPLKNRAKDKVLAITEGLVSLQKNKDSGQLLEDIEILLNYLKLAKSFGWIDSINFLIISKEYEKIKNQVSDEEPLNKPTQKTENASEIGVRSGFAKKPDLTPIFQKVTFQKTVENQVSFTEEKTILQEAHEFSISERQKKILQILKEKGKAQVADFKTVLADVTKRTIRRDLDELLKNKEIIRVGEWNQVFYELGHS